MKSRMRTYLMFFALSLCCWFLLALVGWYISSEAGFEKRRVELLLVRVPQLVEAKREAEASEALASGIAAGAVLNVLTNVFLVTALVSAVSLTALAVVLHMVGVPPKRRFLSVAVAGLVATVVVGLINYGVYRELLKRPLSPDALNVLPFSSWGYDTAPAGWLLAYAVFSCLHTVLLLILVRERLQAQPVSEPQSAV